MPTNNITATGSNTSGTNTSDGKSNYQTVKEGWGGRSNFQASYGLGMEPDGIVEGNAILDAFSKADKQQNQQKT